MQSQSPRQTDFPWLPLPDTVWALLPISAALGFGSLGAAETPHSQGRELTGDITGAAPGGSPFPQLPSSYQSLCGFFSVP